MSTLLKTERLTKQQAEQRGMVPMSVLVLHLPDLESMAVDMQRQKVPHAIVLRAPYGYEIWRSAEGRVQLTAQNRRDGFGSCMADRDVIAEFREWVMRQGFEKNGRAHIAEFWRTVGDRQWVRLKGRPFPRSAPVAPGNLANIALKLDTLEMLDLAVKSRKYNTRAAILMDFMAGNWVRKEEEAA